jgi:predicted metal-binding membrane protein
MHKLQKVILLTLILTSALAWVISKDQQSDMTMMMKAMMTYDPLSISLFTVSWTAGMAAMMFPAISPMVLLYNRLIKNDHDNNNDNNSGRLGNNREEDKQISSTTIVVEGKDDEDYNQNGKPPSPSPSPSSNSLYFFKMILFVGSYLAVWALTGLVLLLAWSVPMNTFIVGMQSKQPDIIYGILLIIAGAYQFTPLKTTCIGYCESPLSFFMRRWRSGTVGALKMGTYHGLYCLGCCWPYFLLMIALGWMNLIWMGLFACIIFGEKIWSRGIWIARIAGIGLMALGIIAIIFSPNAHSLLGVGNGSGNGNNENNNDINKNSNSAMNMNMKGGTMDTMKKETGNSHELIIQL